MITAITNLLKSMVEYVKRSPMFPKKNILPVVAMALVLAFSVIVLDGHAACDLDSKAPARGNCSIQCCPAHHLAPVRARGVSLSASTVAYDPIELTDSYHQAMILTRIYRPPII